MFIRAADFEKLVSMLTKPRWLLHLEGACILALTVALYHAGHFRWWMFAALLLAPDPAMLGYLANVKIGAALYNLVHTGKKSKSAARLILCDDIVRRSSRGLGPAPRAAKSRADFALVPARL